MCDVRSRTTTWRRRWHFSAVLPKGQNAMFLRRYFGIEKFYRPAVDGSVFVYLNAPLRGHMGLCSASGIPTYSSPLSFLLFYFCRFYYQEFYNPRGITRGFYHPRDIYNEPVHLSMRHRTLES